MKAPLCDVIFRAFEKTADTTAATIVRLMQLSSLSIALKFELWACIIILSEIADDFKIKTNFF